MEPESKRAFDAEADLIAEEAQGMGSINVPAPRGWSVPNPIPFRTRLRIELERGILLAARWGVAVVILGGLAWFAFMEYSGVRAWARNGQAAYEWAVKTDAEMKQAQQPQPPAAPEATPEPVVE